MVFITGTPENRGRVTFTPNSHQASPSPSGRRGRSASKQNKRAARREADVDSMRSATGSPASFSTSTPPDSAWEDYVRLSSQGEEHYALISALHTSPQSLNTARSSPSLDGDQSFRLLIPPYNPADLSAGTRNSSASPQARCMMHLATSDAASTSSQNFCLFLFEVRFLLTRTRLSLLSLFSVSLLLNKG